MSAAKKEPSKSRPPKHEDVLALTQRNFETGNYRFSKHALEKLNERKITQMDVANVIQNGYWLKREDEFDDAFGCWKYGILGPKNDGGKVLIHVAFETAEGKIEQTLVITVYDRERGY